MANDDDLQPGPSPALIDDVANWLMGEALGTTDAGKLLEQCSLRLDAAGVPLWRTNIGFRVLHPLYQGVSLTWYRDTGLQPVQTFGQGAGDTNEAWRASPAFYIIENGLPFLRRRLIGPQAQLDFPMLEELRDKGATDYLTWTIPFEGSEINEDDNDGMVGSWTTDRPGGFTDEDLLALRRIQRRLAVACKMTIREQITQNVLSAYLGRDAGRQVLRGKIHLGDGQTIFAVVWFNDLRQSTRLADNMEASDYLALLNAYFECTAGAVLAHGGEVLRFVGDAVLAIFPFSETAGDERRACCLALDAAAEAERRLAALNGRRAKDGREPIDFGIGLHVGGVMYGNIGVPERVEFSVIGPAANEAARLEDLSKTVGHRVIASGKFAEIAGGAFESLGEHVLRGVGEAVEVFTPTGEAGEGRARVAGGERSKEAAE